MNDSAVMAVCGTLCFLVSPFIVYFAVKLGRVGYLTANDLFDKFKKEREQRDA